MHRTLFMTFCFIHCQNGEWGREALCVGGALLVARVLYHLWYRGAALTPYRDLLVTGVGKLPN